VVVHRHIDAFGHALSGFVGYLRRCGFGIAFRQKACLIAKLLRDLKISQPLEAFYGRARMVLTGRTVNSWAPQGLSAPCAHLSGARVLLGDLQRSVGVAWSV
jgi:hypothetical protein